MISPVSARTHKDFRYYSISDAEILYKFIEELRIKASNGCNTPYNTDAYLRHTIINKHQLKVLIDMAVTAESDVKIPGNLIFWVYRSCVATDTKCPIELPHICKIQSPNGEQFFITSKEDWAAHRDATVNQDKPIQVSDHAKLQYLSRVMHLDVEGMLKMFPFNLLEEEGRLLEDGRREHEIGDYLFIMDKNVCVTILNKSMVVI